jgi:mono/diheme cytochrome c family protein
LSEAVTEEGGFVTALKVEWQEETWPIEEGQQIAWMTEMVELDGATELPQVASYDPTTQIIELNKPLKEVPEAGTRLAVAPGAILHQGRMLYAEHCQHCHGVSGDGAGPTSRYLNPLPRDYRDGKFKFTSTPYTHPPARADLARIIEHGIPGTYMPSFKLLEPHEMDSLVEYVRWLAMRGQSESILVNYFKSATDSTKEVTDETAQELADFLPDEVQDVVVRAWNEAEQEQFKVMPETPRPEPTPESIARGQELFVGTAAKCSDCHGKSGLGDGFQTRQVEEGQTEPGLHDAWGHVVTPRNLRAGIYRGGRRPIDIYRRIAAGIKGTPMNGFKTNLYDTMGDRKDEDLWHVVNYVLSLPYEDRQPGEGIEPEGAAEAPPKASSEVAAAEASE